MAKKKDDAALPAEPAPPLGRAERYWVESRRPLAALAFILPLLMIYEAGVLWFGVSPNGADDFMRRLLDLLGFSRHFLLPLLTVGILLGWHHLSRAPWRIAPGVPPAMAVESIVLALALHAIAVAQNAVLSLGRLDAAQEGIKRAIGFLGAGVYEELLFRLILFSALAWAIRRAGVPGRWGAIAAAATVSLLFAAAHHVGPAGEAFAWPPFLFRFVAGLYFSAAFVYRGFGIAAGSHAAYDILAGTF